MSIEEREWDLAAAEYVLGISSDEDRKVFDRLYQIDEDWITRVHRWESRLDPLHKSTVPVNPPAYVLTQVIARINSEKTVATPITDLLDSSELLLTERGDDASIINQPRPATQVASTRNQGSAPSSSSVITSLEQWRERARYWQLATLMAVASLVGVAVLGPDYIARQYAQPDIGKTVAVLQSEELQPLWTVTYSAPSDRGGTVSTGRVSITVVGEPQLTAEQDHQLWMVLSGEAGVQSVGLVPNVAGESITFDLPVGIEEATEFAISIESLGGVPGPAHGPVVTRAFIVKARSDI